MHKKQDRRHRKSGERENPGSCSMSARLLADASTIVKRAFSNGTCVLHVSIKGVYNLAPLTVSFNFQVAVGNGTVLVGVVIKFLLRGPPRPEPRCCRRSFFKFGTHVFSGVNLVMWSAASSLSPGTSHGRGREVRQKGLELSQCVSWVSA